jgi:hypothetical protein
MTKNQLIIFSRICHVFIYFLLFSGIVGCCRLFLYECSSVLVVCVCMLYCTKVLHDIYQLLYIQSSTS